jgi:hypothetical protein
LVAVGAVRLPWKAYRMGCAMPSIKMIEVETSGWDFQKGWLDEDLVMAADGERGVVVCVGTGRAAVPD